ncbi:MAG: hypothetical protein E2O65_14560, partial [Gammaproteobacteria bacterium]
MISTTCGRSSALSRFKVAALLLLSCTALSTGAQESSAALETLVVSGTRVADSAGPLRAITVLDAAVIEARNDSSVLDL